MYIPTPSPVTLNSPGLFYSNINYGDTNRESMDIFIPMTAGLKPVVIEFHSGGFVSGSKESLYAGGVGAAKVNSFLDNGIAYIACNYDLVELTFEEEGFISSMMSGLKAVQFIKTIGSELNIDKDKIGLKGGSSGGGICMWLGYNQDLSIPADPNPFRKESNMVKSISITNPQSTYDYFKWESEVFAQAIPQYKFKNDYSDNQISREGVNRSYGSETYVELENATITAKRAAIDILRLLQSNSNALETRIENLRPINDTLFGSLMVDGLHSPRHVATLKNYLDGNGYVSKIDCPSLNISTTGGESEVDFFIRTLV